MSADILRRAAALMRERAEAATSGPWHADDDYGTVTATPYTNARQAYDRDYRADVDCAWVIPESMDSGVASNDLCHIASWHPAVALAVADWLDDIGERHKPDPDPAELVLHYEQDCPTGECEDPGYHTVTACWGCYPTWDGMDGRSVYPCAETRAALVVARAYLGEQP